MKIDKNKEKLLIELEEEAEKLHNSTKTNISFLSPVHNYLRSKSNIYYHWSISSKASIIHWACTLGFIISVLIFIFLQFIFIKLGI